MSSKVAGSWSALLHWGEKQSGGFQKLENVELGLNRYRTLTKPLFNDICACGENKPRATCGKCAQVVCGEGQCAREHIEHKEYVTKSWQYQKKVMRQVKQCRPNVNPFDVCGGLKAFLLNGESAPQSSKSTVQEKEQILELIKTLNSVRVSVKNHIEQHNKTDAKLKFNEMASAIRKKQGVNVYRGALAELFDGDLKNKKLNIEMLKERIEKNSKYALYRFLLSYFFSRLITRPNEEEKMDETGSSQHARQLEWEQMHRLVKEPFDEAAHAVAGECEELVQNGHFFFEEEKKESNITKM